MNVLHGENKRFAQGLTMSDEHYYSCHATEHFFMMYLGHFTSRLHDIVCKGTANKHGAYKCSYWRF